MHEAIHHRTFKIPIPTWPLGVWGASVGVLIGAPVLVSLGYAFTTQPPGSTGSLVVLACAVVSLLGCAGIFVFSHALGAQIRGISAAGMSTARLRHPVREIGEVVIASQAATRALRAVHASVHRAEEEERRRLARELHDELGQELALLHIWLKTACHAEMDAAARMQTLGNCELLAGTVLERVRSMALDLRPAQLDDLGLPAALRTLGRRIGRQTGITVTLMAIPQTAQRFPETTETALYRIAQAAVTNAVRHAGASTLWMALEVQDNLATVKVQDDGAGFDLDVVNARSTQAGGGMGLRVMQERIQALGGTMEVITAPGTGTLVKASLPIGEGKEK